MLITKLVSLYFSLNTCRTHNFRGRMHQVAMLFQQPLHINLLPTKELLNMDISR